MQPVHGWGGGRELWELIFGDLSCFDIETRLLAVGACI